MYYVRKNETQAKKYFPIKINVYFPKPLGAYVRVELDLSSPNPNSNPTKADLKNARNVNTLDLAKNQVDNNKD